MSRRNKVHASALSDRIQQQSERLVEEVRELGHIAREATGDALRRARRRSEETLDSGRRSVRHGADEFEGLVVDNPLRSVLVALGLGLLIGLFVRR